MFRRWSDEKFYGFMTVLAVVLFLVEAAMVVGLIWVGVSFLDVIVHNLTEGWTPGSWNFFSVFK